MQRSSLESTSDPDRSPQSQPCPLTGRLAQLRVVYRPVLWTFQGPVASSISSESNPRRTPGTSATFRMARSAPATYGSGLSPGSWRITSRSPAPPKTISVATTKLGNRTEWIRVPGHLGAARLDRAAQLGQRNRGVGCADLCQGFGEFLRGAARHVRLVGAGVEKDLPMLQILSSRGGGPLPDRGHDREVARRNHSHSPVAGKIIELGVVVGG
jgi:hypothetical protein